MSEKKPYIVLIACDAKGLGKKVSEHWNLGYRPQGGVSANGTDISTYVAQAMILKDLQ